MSPSVADLSKQVPPMFVLQNIGMIAVIMFLENNWPTMVENVE